MFLLATHSSFLCHETAHEPQHTVRAIKLRTAKTGNKEEEHRAEGE